MSFFARSGLIGAALWTGWLGGALPYAEAQTRSYDATLSTDSPAFFAVNRPLQQVPSFPIETALGQTNLKALIANKAAGKRVLILFWSPTCQICVDEAAEMAARAQSNESPILIPIAIQEKGQAVLPLFVKRHKLDLPLQWVEGFENLPMLPLRGLPTGFLIDEKGFLIERREGAHAWASPPP